MHWCQATFLKEQHVTDQLLMMACWTLMTLVLNCLISWAALMSQIHDYHRPRHHLCHLYTHRHQPCHTCVTCTHIVISLVTPVSPVHTSSSALSYLCHLYTHHHHQPCHHLYSHHRHLCHLYTSVSHHHLYDHMYTVAHNTPPEKRLKCSLSTIQDPENFTQTVSLICKLLISTYSETTFKQTQNSSFAYRVNM